MRRRARVAWGLARGVRPHQWGKNVLVFAGVVFGQRLFTRDILLALAGFVVFCALAGALYLLNDVADRERDRRHPAKRRRPVAAGDVPPGVAVAAAVVLLGGALAAAAALGGRFLLVALGYAGLLGAYSVWLKHRVIIDILTVAVGFVLRAVAGAVVVAVEISGWLLICTFLVALFLALGKRRHEWLALGADAVGHRPILAAYSPALLDQMIAVVTASTVTAYALYTMAPETVAKFHTALLPLTLPSVVYGIFRYLWLLYHRERGDNPAALVIEDRALLVNTLLWALAVVAIVYGPRWLAAAGV